MEQRKSLGKSYLKTILLSIVATTISTIIIYTFIGRKPTELEDSMTDIIVLITHQIIFCVFLLGIFTLNSNRMEKNSWFTMMLIWLPSLPMGLSIIFVWLDYLMREELTRTSFLMVINSIISLTILVWNFIQMKKAIKEHNNQELLDR